MQAALNNAYAQVPCFVLVILYLLVDVCHLLSASLKNELIWLPFIYCSVPTR
jgi:hypothetical protein